MRPTDCPRCEPFFSPLLAAEARMELVKRGPSAAKVLVDERLETFHSEHDEVGWEDVDDS